MGMRHRDQPVFSGPPASGRLVARGPSLLAEATSPPRPPTIKPAGTAVNLCGAAAAPSFETLHIAQRTHAAAGRPAS